MTNVHRRGSSFAARLAQIIAVVGVTVSLAVPPASGTGPPPTNPIIHAKMLVARLSNALAKQEAKSQALGQQYDGVISSLDALKISIAKFKTAIAHKKLALHHTTHDMIRSLIRSYVDGTASSVSIPLLNLNVTQAAAQKIYVEQVLGDLNAMQRKLNRQERSLNRTVYAESVQRSQAAADVHQIRSLIFQNQTIQASTKATLSVISSTLRTEIVNYEIAVATKDARAGDTSGIENAIAAASAVGGQSAANKVIAAANAATVRVPTNTVTGTAAGSKSGLAAVRAAESQIGVPYVWGGETPGQGFDCSGLTQWAWAQAGYSIPRTTSTQYNAMRHVPLNAVRPGDLLFYFNLDGDNSVDHEVMYVGSGPYGTNTVIAAAHTGTLVGFEPMFTYGLIGVGRP